MNRKVAITVTPIIADYVSSWRGVSDIKMEPDDACIKVFKPFRGLGVRKILCLTNKDKGATEVDVAKIIKESVEPNSTQGARQVFVLLYPYLTDLRSLLDVVLQA